MAQAFPDRPVGCVSGDAPGGSTDMAARILADRPGADLAPDPQAMVENPVATQATTLDHEQRR